MCGGPARTVITGTVEPRAYFGGSDYRIADGDRARLDVLRCGACGHGWSPLPPDVDVLAWYRRAPADPAYMAEARGRGMAAAAVLAHLARFRAPPGALVDVGAGAGFLVGKARHAGWSPTGLEPAAWAADAAARNGLGDIVRHADLTALGAMHDIDAVTAMDVIEHLPDPGVFLAACAKALKPGGALAVVTPRFDSLAARLFGARWYCVMPAHLHYFTRRSLALLMEAYGFRVASVGHHVRWFSPAYVLARALGKTASGGPAVPVPLFDTLEMIAIRT